MLLKYLFVPKQKRIFKTFEKLGKCKDLEIDISRLWQLRTTALSVVIGALGIISNETNKYVEQIPVSLKIYKLQEIILMGTFNILRRFLSMQ